MDYRFTKELDSLAEIEEMVENTGLLKNAQIRKIFDFLMSLRDELFDAQKEGKDIEYIESILEDISYTTKELTFVIETKYTDKIDEATVYPFPKHRYH